MRQLDLAKTEMVRALTVAAHYVGLEVTIDELATFAKSKKATAEPSTRFVTCKVPCLGMIMTQLLSSISVKTL